VRARVIPFTVEIPEEDVDENLPSKLKAEWPGILAWAVRGCRRWNRDGLGYARAVNDAVAQWQHGVDHIQRFVGESVVLEADNIVRASMMYDHYKEWCGRNGEQPISTAELKARLQELDLRHKETKRGSEWRGVKLRR